jgi:hypothetical protein
MSTSAVARIEQPAQIVDLIASWPDAMNPWGCLSSRYCDYNSFTPQNGLIQYTHGRDGISRNDTMSKA